VSVDFESLKVGDRVIVEPSPAFMDDEAYPLIRIVHDERTGLGVVVWDGRRVGLVDLRQGTPHDREHYEPTEDEV
jgi:hypothetical protein